MMELRNIKWYLPKDLKNAQSLSCQLLFYFGKCVREMQTEGPVAKEMNILFLVELGPKTTMQSALLINWPTDPSPPSLAKFGSSRYLGWLHERTKEESTREEGLHTHTLELFTHSVH